MFSRTECPYCSYPLLLHSCAGKPYWFCQHCHQKVPHGVDIQRPALEPSEDFAAMPNAKDSGDRSLEAVSELNTQNQTVLQNELAKLNQLKNDFLCTTSHELRTPLSNMRMSLQMLEIMLKQTGLLDSEQSNSNSSLQPARIAYYLNLLNEECDREINLINDLLMLQQLEAGTQALLPIKLPLHDWILQIVHLFEGQMISKQQNLYVDISADLPPLVTDFTLLDRLLSELLHNACKFTAVGGEIKVTASALAGRMRIQIANSSAEISADDLVHIFDKFYRISKDDPWQHRGTGLGLALAKQLALSLGGSLWAESSSEQTCFTVELPCQDSQVVTKGDILMSYIAYYLSRGKTVLSLLNGKLPFEGEVYQYWGYHRDFLDFWRRLQQRHDFLELYLEGDDHPFRHFLSGNCTVTECARCRLPIPTAEGHTYSTPSCLLCDEPAMPESRQEELYLQSLENRPRLTQVVAIVTANTYDAMLSKSLAVNGFEITPLTVSEAASSQSLPRWVDLVLIDAEISETEAQNLAQQLCHYPQLQGVQIVALSSQNHFSLPWTERVLGIEDYLLSPLGGDRLAHQLRQISRYQPVGCASQLHWFPR